MDLGFQEMFFIVVLALLLFGPRKLPEIGRQIGKALAEFKRAKNEFTAQIEDEVRRLELEEENKSTASALVENRILPPDAIARESLDENQERGGLESTASDNTAANAQGSHA